MMQDRRAGETVRAVVARERGGPDVLTLGHIAKPSHGDHDLLVRVHATALNRADLLQREGKYPPPAGASPVLGLEVAGTVEAAGRRCSRWKNGDRVCGLLAGGGYAEVAVIHGELALSMPPSLSFEEAAAIPEAFLTAFQALHWYGHLAPEDIVLIHAGGSGVGTAAIQLASVVGARVLATASAGKHEACLSLGAESAIDYRTEDFVERVAELTGNRGADVILDFVGAPYFARNIASLAIDGRIVLLATLGGARVEEVDLRTLFAKRATLSASTLRSRDVDYKIRLISDFRTRAWPLFEGGTLRPVIDRVMSWREVAEAHRIMADNRNTGKIVLRVD